MRRQIIIVMRLSEFFHRLDRWLDAEEIGQLRVADEFSRQDRVAKIANIIRRDDRNMIWRVPRRVDDLKLRATKFNARLRRHDDAICFNEKIRFFAASRRACGWSM